MNEVHHFNTLGAIGIVLLILIGIGGGWSVGYQSGNEKGYEKGYGEATFSAEAKLEDYQMTRAPALSRSVSGTIERVEGNTLYVKIPDVNPIKGTTERILAVKVNDSTVIEQTSPKEETVFRGEMDDFLSASASRTSSSTGLKPPTPFILSTVLVTDLRLGQTLSITATEDIGKANEITAASIHSIATLTPQ
jgi:hypothetical protein